MNIGNVRELKRFAGERVANAHDPKRIVLIYTGLTIALSLLGMAADYMLDLQIGKLGGLSNMGTRTVLSTFQSILPLAQSVLSMCLSVGFLSAMLRIARGQFASPQGLRLGFDRFWVLLRSSVIQGLIYSGVLIGGVYIGIMIFMISPLSGDVMELLAPYVTDVTVLDSAIVLEDAVYAQFFQLMWPAYLICGVVLAVLGLPIVYYYRMVNYVIIDKPAMGALAALRESKKMMRGNRLKLLKLDISMWWYYGALTLASVICYGDEILPMLGVALPFSPDVSFFLFYALYLAATAVIYYFMLDRVEVTYALAYDAVKPEEPKDNGVVLGNIFQM